MSKKNGAVAAIVDIFRVAENETMRESSYTYTVQEAPGRNIYRLRREAGWSQRTLAEKCKPELEHTTIRRIEHNLGYTQDSLERIAAALKVSVSSFFLPPELAKYEKLNADNKKRINEFTEDLYAAEQFRRNQSA